MEDQIERPIGDTTIESYWLVRKREREALAKEKDEQALIILGKACEYYTNNYPKSIHGIEYEGKNEKLPKASFKLKRDDAILLRKVIEYYKTEDIISVDDEVKIGHCLWRVNENIPDLSQINKLARVENEIKEKQKEAHILRNTPEEIPKIVVEKELHFICQWCDKEFVGETARIEIKAHILKCPKSPTALEEPLEEEKIPEKVFTCQLCGIQLKRKDMKDHAVKGGCTPKKSEEPKVEVSTFVCPVEDCGKDCKNGAGLASHMKSHNKE